MSKAEVKKVRGNLILCMLYLVMAGILLRNIGGVGMANFAFAVTVFLILFSLLVAWIPDYVMKMVRFRLLKEQYKNVKKVWKTMLFFGILVGLFGTGILLLVSVNIQNHSEYSLFFSYLLLQRLAVLFLPLSVAAVLLGYFRGCGGVVPSNCALIVPTVLGIPVILIFAANGFHKGEGISALLHNASLSGIYGAIGGIRGFFAVAVLTFLMLFLIWASITRKSRKNRQDGMKLTEDARDILFPIVANTFSDAVSLFCLPGVLFFGLLFFVTEVQKTGEDLIFVYEYLTVIGQFYGGFLVLAGAECALILLVMVKFLAMQLSCLKKDDRKVIRHGQNGIVLASFEAALFFAALNIGASNSVARLFFGDDNPALTKNIRFGAFLPVFMAGAFVFSILLKETGKKKSVLLNNLIGFAGFVLASMISFKFTGISAMPVLIGFYVYFGIVSVLCAIRYLSKYNYMPEWVRMIVMPVLISIVSALAIYFINSALYRATNALVAVTFSLCLGYVIYTLCLIFMRCIQESDTDVIPFGAIKRTIGNFLHIMV